MQTLAGNPTSAQISRWLRAFIAPGQVTELRAIGVSRPQHRAEHIEAGFFDSDHIDAMIRHALDLSSMAKGVYFIPNPLNPDLLARICNRVRVVKSDQLATDRDVLRRRWMLVDADPRRIAGVSATDAEKDAAREVILTVRDHLDVEGWPAPVLADSGNGYHLLYPIDLPVGDDGLVRRCLHALAARFATDAVGIDTAVFNPARIVKLYGTAARKGDSTATRPHRRSALLEGWDHA